MNFKKIFDPSKVSIHYPDGSLGSSIHRHKYDLLEQEDVLDIAVIGLTEYRGGKKAASSHSSEAIREQLYTLENTFDSHKVIDLGNLKSGASIEEDCERLNSVCNYLMRKNILPILFGGEHHLAIGQFEAYESFQKPISLLTLDNKIDIDGTNNADSHLKKLLERHSKDLRNLIHLGHQKFLVSNKALSLLEKQQFDVFRLGLVKKSLEEIEPYIREANMVSFGLSSVNQIDAPASSRSNSFGLSSYEACQLCLYMGQSEVLTSIGFYGFDKFLDKENRTSFLTATLIWYVMEGFYQRVNDCNFDESNHVVYEVKMKESEEAIVFYKSRQTNRWWVKARYKTEDGNDDFFMLPCSFTDYEQTSQGEIPKRLFYFWQRS